MVGEEVVVPVIRSRGARTDDHPPGAHLAALAPRQVILVGDFNVAATPVDVHASLAFPDLYAAEELAALHALTEGPAAYVDVWRRLHPGTSDVYTVWDERTSARAFNHGLRIDYILCTPGLLPSVAACEVVGTDRLPPKWSDHAGLLLRLRDLAPPAPAQPCALWQRRWESLVDTRQRSIKDMFGSRGGPPKRRRTGSEQGPQVDEGPGGEAGVPVEEGAAVKKGVHVNEGVNGQAWAPADAALNGALPPSVDVPSEEPAASQGKSRKIRTLPGKESRAPGQRSLTGFFGKQA